MTDQKQVDNTLVNVFDEALLSQLRILKSLTWAVFINLIISIGTFAFLLIILVHSLEEVVK